MKGLHVAFLSAAVTLGCFSASEAADPAAETATIVSSAFDWNGFYAGFGGSYSQVTGPAATNQVYATGRAGGNKTIDSFVLGAEIYGSLRYDLTPGTTGVVVGAQGRAGVLASDAVLLYGTLGGFYDFDFAWSATAGAGMGVRLTDNLSIDLQYQHQWDLDAPYSADNFATSLLWHF